MVCVVGMVNEAGLALAVMLLRYSKVGGDGSFSMAAMVDAILLVMLSKRPGQQPPIEPSAANCGMCSCHL